jgi:hypothetical protein
MRGWPERDEELAAVRIRSSIGHRENARLAVPQGRVELVAELVARPAGTLSQAVAPLDHEVLDDPVENHAVVERGFLRRPRDGIGPFLRAFGQAHEICDGVRRLPVEKSSREVAFAGFKPCVRPFFQNRLLVSRGVATANCNRERCSGL